MTTTHQLQEIVSSTLQSIGANVLTLRVDCLRDCNLPTTYATEHDAADEIAEAGFVRLGSEIEQEYREALVNRLRRAEKQIAEAIADTQTNKGETK